MSPAASSRWCPTPEQLMILEELYRSGIITPNASQIQRITCHLSLYGNIEGKNVFYWFQNHKARDRQKFKKKLIKQLQQSKLNYFNAPPPPSRTLSPFHLRSYPNSHASLPQGGLEGATIHMMMNQPCKMEIPQSVQMENSMMRMYGHDKWRMMEVGPPAACSSSSERPLETLELFPTTATNLKEECNNNSKISRRLLSTDHFLSL